MTVRLTLICQAATVATRKAAFAADDPLEEGAASALRRVSISNAATAEILIGPSAAARQTAEGLSLAGSVDRDLRDLDYGRWSGRSIAEVGAVEPEAMACWIADPAFDGHGGEPRSALHARTAAWLARQAEGRGRTIAVTHAAFIRAALLHVLGAPEMAFWRIDVTPLSLTDLRHDGRRWAVRAFGCPLREQDRTAAASKGGFRC